jgi:hypothetical protein
MDRPSGASAFIAHTHHAVVVVEARCTTIAGRAAAAAIDVGLSDVAARSGDVEDFVEAEIGELVLRLELGNLHGRSSGDVRSAYTIGTRNRLAVAVERARAARLAEATQKSTAIDIRFVFILNAVRA